MSHTKAGDVYQLSTTTYVSDMGAQKKGQNDYRNPSNSVSMFQTDQSNTPMELICLENPNKEFNFMLNSEFNMLREKQEIKASEAELLKAKEEQKEASEKLNQDETATGVNTDLSKANSIGGASAS